MHLGLKLLAVHLTSPPGNGCHPPHPLSFSRPSGRWVATQVRVCSDTGDVGRAFAVVAELEQAGVEVAAPLFAALLSACARGGQPARASAELVSLNDPS